MPSHSEQQRKFIFAKRNQYGSKDKAPEKWKWVFDKEWETIEEMTYKKIFTEEKHWITLNPKQKEKLLEDLRLSDLMQHSGMSDFTTRFRKARNKLVKGEANTAKLKSIKVNRNQDYIIFTFKTKPTPDGTIKGAVDPKADFAIRYITRNYTMEIKILNFFKWADTTPGFTKAHLLSIDDLKEILKSASIQVWCDCPSQWWQGLSYYLTMFNASIYPNNITPKHWGKYHNKGDGLVCKHLSGLLSSIVSSKQRTGFFLNQMVSMLNKYVKSHNL